MILNYRGVAMRICVAVLFCVVISLFAATKAAFAQTSSAPSSHSEASSQSTNQAAAQAAYEQAMGLLQEGKAADALAVIDAAVRGGARDASLLPQGVGCERTGA